MTDLSLHEALAMTDLSLHEALAMTVPSLRADLQAKQSPLN